MYESTHVDVHVRVHVRDIHLKGLCIPERRGRCAPRCIDGEPRLDVPSHTYHGDNLTVEMCSTSTEVARTFTR